MNQSEVNRTWKDYELIQTGNGMKLERWGKIKLLRPDPQIIWKSNRPWSEFDAEYIRSNSGGGHWNFKKKIPQNWIIRYGSLAFKTQPTNFKHTGLFPEQAINWDWIANQCGRMTNLNVLNLFAYTGGATVAAVANDAMVTHVDAAKGMVEWAKENIQLSNLSERPVRFLVDDCLKFVEREIRRNNKYDAIIMDPPSYGRGKQGEIWKLEKHIQILLDACKKLCSDRFRFFLINSYTTGLSSTVLSNLVHTSFQFNSGTLEAGELGIPESGTNLVLPCGTFCRWSSD
ncbi:MAG: class I SAM-dependent methyltransferase [Calditrichaeota bacterium]|nr:class I SAM-dependent methyltransferase [Calditrichota bacterium]